MTEAPLYPRRIAPLYGLTLAMLVPLVIMQEFWRHFHPLMTLAFALTCGALTYYAIREYRIEVRSGGHEGGHGAVRAAHLVVVTLVPLVGWVVMRALFMLAYGQPLRDTASPQVTLAAILPLDRNLAWYILSVLLIGAVYWLAHRFPGVRFDFNLKLRFKLIDVLILAGFLAATWAGLWCYNHYYGTTHPRMGMFGIDLATHGPLLYWGAGVLFSVANAFTEEMWYRGFLLGALKPLVTPARAIILQALVFGLLHWFGTPQGILGVLLAGSWGALLGWWTYKRGSLWPAFLVHFFADFLIFAYTN